MSVIFYVLLPGLIAVRIGYRKYVEIVLNGVLIRL